MPKHYDMPDVLLDDVCPECGTEEAGEPGVDHPCPECGRLMV
jgi:predicted RNA-binding Zn-ribbon protein involved in translation (DUF1610 family)